MKLSVGKYTMEFKEGATTSRGTLYSKPCYLLYYSNEESNRIGIGEASYFPGLSPSSIVDFEKKILELRENISQACSIDFSGFPEIKFGYEQALADYKNGGKSLYFPSGFTEGKFPIQINGLIWMGDKKAMLERIKQKLNDGFHCIKIKIGAITWEDEIELIKFIRKRFGNSIEIRVDANGGLDYKDCLFKLNQLFKLKVHSIEQPIPKGNWEKMRKICKESPIPIALDEELIGIDNLSIKNELLDFIRPQYIILKPSFCGGFSGTDEWINMAEKKGIGWWITSALESAVGLNALAQYTASLNVKMPQGLGTGKLYKKDFPSPLTLSGEFIYYTGFNFN